MNRRTVLASAGSVLLVGCLSESTLGGVGTEPSPTTTSRKTTVRGTSTTSKEPILRIPDENRCPTFDDDVKRVVCYENAESETTLLVEPSAERATLPKTTLSFTLTNETGATFTTNYYAWSVWKRVDDEWFHVAPRVVPEPAMLLDSGDSHAWNLTRR